MLILDDSSEEALAVDPFRPASSAALDAVLLEAWPRLHGRVHRIDATIEEVALQKKDLVVSVHACGALTDAVLSRAIEARAHVAVLPCCHDLATCDTGALQGWMDGPMAIDASRVARLRQASYTVHTQTIPLKITPKNRLLIGLASEATPR